MREIGSDFWEIRECETYDFLSFIGKKSSDNIVLLKSGRNAIKALCEVLRSRKTVLLPAFTCSTVIEPFCDSKFEILYYDINEDFTIDTDSLNYLIANEKPDLILVHSYWGFNTCGDADLILQQFRNSGGVLVEDLTQSLFSENVRLGADYYVSSLQKFFAIPNGGFIMSKNQLNIEKEDDKSGIDVIASKTFMLKKDYMAYKNDAKAQFKEGYKKINAIMEDNSAIYGISQMSEHILNKLDIGYIKEQRVKNYNYLHDYVNENCKKLRVAMPKAGQGTVPLYFPVFPKNRSAFQAYMSERDVYCPIIWPKSEMIKGSFPTADKMYNNLICIPIDQRYTEEDMKHIGEVLSGYENVRV